LLGNITSNKESSQEDRLTLEKEIKTERLKRRNPIIFHRKVKKVLLIEDVEEKMEPDGDKANDAHENIQEVSKRKAKDKLMINQITQLHNVCTNEYIVDLEKIYRKNKQRKTIRSIAQDFDFKRSTVSDYFQQFKENPNYLNEQLQSHRNSAFHLARK